MTQPFRAVTPMILLSIIFVLSRFTNLLDLPVYSDEVLYLTRANATLEGDIFFSLRQSLKPIYVWLVAIFLPFSEQPLWVLRAISAVSGLLTMWLCYHLAMLFYGERRIGYLAAGLYLLTPFALFYNRLGITDSLLTLLMGVTIWLSFRLVQTPSLTVAFWLGVTIAAATLTKTYGILYGVAPLLFFGAFGRWSAWRALLKPLSVTYGLTTILGLVPLATIGAAAFQLESERRAVYASDANIEAANLLLVNTLTALEWLTAYFTWPFLALLTLSLLAMVWQRARVGLILGLLTLQLIAFFIIISTDWHSRYLLPIIVPTSIISAWGIHHGLTWLQTRPRLTVASYLILSALTIPALWFNYTIIRQPQFMPMPIVDQNRYIYGNSGLGWGLQQSLDLLESQATPETAVSLLTESARGRWAAYINLALPTDTSIRPIQIDDFGALTPAQLDEYATIAPLFALVPQRNINTPDDPFAIGSVLQRFNTPQLWHIATFPNSAELAWEWRVGVYRWVLPHEFARLWLQQGGEADPQIATLVEWQESPQQPDYLLVTPDSIEQTTTPLSQFVTIENGQLRLQRLPSDWRLAYLHPDGAWLLLQQRPPHHQATATFGELIRLEGYDLSSSKDGSDGEAHSAERLHITLYWRSLQTVARPYQVSVQLLDSVGRLITQSDSAPLQGQWPTSRWQVDDRLADRHTLRLPLDLSSGDYTLTVSLYDPQTVKRLAVASTEQSVVSEAIVLQQFIHSDLSGF